MKKYLFPLALVLVLCFAFCKLTGDAPLVPTKGGSSPYPLPPSFRLPMGDLVCKVFTLQNLKDNDFVQAITLSFPSTLYAE